MDITDGKDIINGKNKLAIEVYNPFNDGGDVANNVVSDNIKSGRGWWDPLRFRVRYTLLYSFNKPVLVNTLELKQFGDSKFHIKEISVAAKDLQQKVVKDRQIITNWNPTTNNKDEQKKSFKPIRTNSLTVYLTPVSINNQPKDQVQVIVEKLQFAYSQEESNN
jgi:hypothetical protein